MCAFARRDLFWELLSDMWMTGLLIWKLLAFVSFQDYWDPSAINNLEEFWGYLRLWACNEVHGQRRGSLDFWCDFLCLGHGLGASFLIENMEKHMGSRSLRIEILSI